MTSTPVVAKSYPNCSGQDNLRESLPLPALKVMPTARFPSARHQQSKNQLQPSQHPWVTEASSPKFALHIHPVLLAMYIASVLRVIEPLRRRTACITRRKPLRIHMSVV